MRYVLIVCFSIRSNVVPIFGNCVSVSVCVCFLVGVFVWCLGLFGASGIVVLVIMCSRRRVVLFWCLAFCCPVLWCRLRFAVELCFDSCVSDLGVLLLCPISILMQFMHLARVLFCCAFHLPDFSRSLEFVLVHPDHCACLL